ncbi:MAG: hypothetical protein HYX36_12490 [Rhizobiales bacterium]|nr:hypothetical protein [Hyphomicrobiales bacterium]
MSRSFLGGVPWLLRQLVHALDSAAIGGGGKGFGRGSLRSLFGCVVSAATNVATSCGGTGKGTRLLARPHFRLFSALGIRRPSHDCPLRLPGRRLFNRGLPDQVTLILAYVAALAIGSPDIGKRVALVMLETRQNLSLAAGPEAIATVENFAIVQDNIMKQPSLAQALHQLGKTVGSHEREERCRLVVGEVVG